MANFSWICIREGLWAPTIVPIVPLRHTPARNTVNDILTKTLEDTSFPLPPNEDLHSVKDFYLCKEITSSELTTVLNRHDISFEIYKVWGIKNETHSKVGH